MNKLERILDKIEKENKKKEDSAEKIKELKLQAKELEKEFENKRKIDWILLALDPKGQLNLISYLRRYLS